MELQIKHSLRVKEKLEKALKLEMDYLDQSRREEIQRSLPTLKPAAVLVLLAFTSKEVQEGDLFKNLSLLFILRTEEVENHKGQVAFPGGFSEPEDRKVPAITALRETEEEVGIPREMVHLIGDLPALPTTTGFLIQPVVGVLTASLENVRLTLNKSEIAEVMWIPLSTLVWPGIYHSELWKMGEKEYPIHVYQVNHYRIWGATGAITKNLLDRISTLS